MFFPHGDEALPAVVIQVHAASRSGDKVIGGNLAPAYDGNNESICHGTQFFRQVKSEGRTACAGPMEKPDLIVESDALGGTDTLGHQHGIAKPEHGVDRVARRTPGPAGKLEFSRRDRSSERTEIDPGGIALNAPDLVAGAGLAKPRETLSYQRCTR